MSFRKNKIINPLLARIRKSDIGLRLAKGMFWSFTGTASGKFLILLASIFCARILGQESFGEFGMIRSTINMFVVLGSAGLGLTATKYISEFRELNKNKVSSIYILTNLFALSVAIIGTILVLLFSSVIADVTLKAPHLTDDIKWGALILFVTIINGAQNGVLSGFEDFKKIAINTFIASVSESTFMLIGAYFYGVTGAIIGYGLGYVVWVVINFFSIQSILRKFSITISLRYFEKKDIKILYKFSLPAALSSILVTPVFWIVRSMLVRDNGFNAAGLYEVADQWRVLILFIPGSISRILLPILSNLESRKSGSTFFEVLKYNIFINSGVAFVLAVIVTILSPVIMHFYGEGFNDLLPLIILAFSTVFTSIASVAGLAIASKSKMWIGFSFNFFWAILTISFCRLFLNMGLGATGLSLAILCSYIIHSILQMIYLFKILKRPTIN